MEGGELGSDAGDAVEASPRTEFALEKSVDSGLSTGSRSGNSRQRRRWWWLAVALLLTMAGGWLAGDRHQRPAEMAGLWRHSKNPGYQKKPLPDLLLRADGSGQFVTAKGGSPMTWWADGPLIVMQHDSRSLAESVHFALGEADARIRSTGWRRPQVRLYVTSLNAERMVFSQISAPERTRDSSDVEELLIRVEE
jgi:hypothetical protein